MVCIYFVYAEIIPFRTFYYMLTLLILLINESYINIASITATRYQETIS